MTTLKKHENIIVASHYTGVTQEVECFFSNQKFDQNKDALQFTWNGKLVSEAYARKTGFIIDEDHITIPNSINSRSKLGKWMTSELGLERGCGEFRRLYGKYSGLPPGHPHPGQE